MNNNKKLLGKHKRIASEVAVGFSLVKGKRRSTLELI